MGSGFTTYRSREAGTFLSRPRYHGVTNRNAGHLPPYGKQKSHPELFWGGPLSLGIPWRRREATRFVLHTLTSLWPMRHYRSRNEGRIACAHAGLAHPLWVHHRAHRHGPTGAGHWHQYVGACNAPLVMGWHQSSWCARISGTGPNTAEQPTKSRPESSGRLFVGALIDRTHGWIQMKYTAVAIPAARVKDCSNFLSSLSEIS